MLAHRFLHRYRNATKSRSTFYLGVVIALALALTATPIAAASGGSMAAATDESEPAFVVDVHADGAADVTVRSTFDLTDDDERTAFESLAEDDSATQAALDRFESRMDTVAAAASDRVDREVSVTNPTIDLRIVGDVGVVELRITWNGVAAVEDDRVVLTEPFASGFTPDRPLTVHAPGGYELLEVEPPADETSATSATWGEGTDLDGFQATFDGSERESTDDGDDGLPGFGVIAGLLAVVFAALRGRTAWRNSA